MRVQPFTAFVLSTLMILPSAVAAAEISGKVILSGEPTTEVVISIEGLKQQERADSTIHWIDHRNLDFVPHVLVVRVGSSVQFKNSDGMPCRIYSLSPGSNFMLRRPDENATTITFQHPGMIEIRCADHSRIHAFILVRENPFFALTSSQGQYQISNLPMGRFTLQVWYEGQVIQTRTLRVESANQTVDIRASVPSRPRPRSHKLDINFLASSAMNFSDDSKTKKPDLWRSPE